MQRDGWKFTGEISRVRLIAALCIAAVSDGLSIWTEFVPPVQWGIDVATALALFVLLGWRWQILPGLIAEAIPGVAALPFWVMVVVAIGLTGEKSDGAISDGAISDGATKGIEPQSHEGTKVE